MTVNSRALGWPASSAAADHANKPLPTEGNGGGSSPTRGPGDKRKLVVMSAIIVAVSLCCTVLIGMIIRNEPLMLTVRQPCDRGQASDATGEMQPMTKASALELEQKLASNLPDIDDDDDDDEPVDRHVPKLQREFSTWVSHLRKTGDDLGIVTQRTFCHELTAKGQTCVFEGLMCVNVTAGSEHNLRPRVLIINDSIPAEMEGTEAPGDNWCGMRYQSADPRYYSSRHWPLLENTVIPQQSCMEARFFKSSSILTKEARIKWIPSISLVNLDYADNDHNTHLAIDLMWLLDAALHDESLVYRPRPGYRRHRDAGDMDGVLFRNDTTFYLPQTRAQFDGQTSRDINRLLWSMILRKDGRRLYPELKAEELDTAPAADVVREAKPVLEAFPELLTDGKFSFHGDIVNDEEHDLMCTARLVAGVKTGFSTHERVCREMRTRAYDTYGIKRPEVQRIGQINFPQPPKSILVLNRHITRTIDNAEEIVEKLQKKLAYMDVPVRYETTNNLNSAEQWVRVFSSAGIIISPHGSHNMGEMFMQRYSVLIEIMPTAYTEHSFNLLSEPCKVWYYEVGASFKQDRKDYFLKECEKKTPHMYDPCNAVKAETMVLDFNKLFPVVLHGLERLGYDTQLWMNDTYDR